MPVCDFVEAEACMNRSKGHCMTMGTASTMACMVEALGLSLPGNAAIPAVGARRNTLAHLTRRRIVEMVREDLVLSRILTRQAFENAISTNAAIGGSTNAVIHLLANAAPTSIFGLARAARRCRASRTDAAWNASCLSQRILRFAATSLRPSAGQRSPSFICETA